ncbi:hypothetical protein J4E89_002005 [Alternaria sp. Ai002NY15]|nr:hypothetical protein J4E89_002005 [Alternaria sp. Ai002NY15]
MDSTQYWLETPCPPIGINQNLRVRIYNLSVPNGIRTITYRWFSPAMGAGKSGFGLPLQWSADGREVMGNWQHGGAVGFNGRGPWEGFGIRVTATTETGDLTADVQILGPEQAG